MIEDYTRNVLMEAEQDHAALREAVRAARAEGQGLIGALEAWDDVAPPAQPRITRCWSGAVRADRDSC